MFRHLAPKKAYNSTNPHQNSTFLSALSGIPLSVIAAHIEKKWRARFHLVGRGHLRLHLFSLSGLSPTCRPTLLEDHAPLYPARRQTCTNVLSSAIIQSSAILFSRLQTRAIHALLHFTKMRNSLCQPKRRWDTSGRIPRHY
jgi:hypothetical protein